MDPTIIVGALIAAIANLAEPAVKDAYQALKALIVKKYNGNAEVQGALAGIEKRPEIWQNPLEASLQDTDANKDEEIITATEGLQRILKEAKARLPLESNIDVKTGNIIRSSIIVGNTSSTINVNSEKNDEHRK